MSVTIPLRRVAFLACTTASLLMTALPAFAQSQDEPKPGTPLYGRPNQPGAMKLKPVAPPPLPTPAAKLPIDKLKVPAGFKVEVYASGIKNARSLRMGDKGTLFVSTGRPTRSGP